MEVQDLGERTVETRPPYNMLDEETKSKQSKETFIKVDKEIAKMIADTTLEFPTSEKAAFFPRTAPDQGAQRYGSSKLG